MRMDKFIKNIDFETALDMAGLVSYQDGQVVSRTLSQNKAVSITLFSFDKGEEISSHASGGDAMVYLMDGIADITIGGNTHKVSKGECIIMPAGVPHALYASERFKMLLVVVFPPT